MSDKPVLDIPDWGEVAYSFFRQYLRDYCYEVGLTPETIPPTWDEIPNDYWKRAWGRMAENFISALRQYMEQT